jgi:hypothetical protein
MEEVRMQRVRSRHLAHVALAVAAALLVGLLAAPSPAAPEPSGARTHRTRAARAEQVPVFPVSELRRGMVGHGLTVISGTEIRSFGVRILGVQPDGIAPGIDFILVELFGDLIEETGGVAAGMSGSPVYIRDRLVGAVAYGFSGGDFRIAGLTPAEPMLAILEYPTGLREPATAARGSSQRWAERIDLAPALREVAVAAAGGDGEMRQLLLPLAVSGLSGRRLDLLREAVADAGLPFIPTAGARAASPMRARRTDPLPPGSVYSAVLSYGDVTFAGIGTTTARVGRRSVAFGHPLLFTGPAHLGLNGGRVLAVVRNILLPFKVANVGLPHGLLTQDRLAGVGGVAGRFPELTPIRTELRNLDLGLARDGATRIVRRFPYLDEIAFFALVANFDRVFDQVGAGSSRLSWTITGTRAGGEAFRFHRENMFASEFDLAFESLFEPALLNLSAILHNPFEPVRITSVRLEGNVTRRDRSLEIVRALVSSSSAPEPSAFAVEARPGDTLTVTVGLRPPRGPRVERTLALQVPEDVAPGSILQLVVRGGIGPGFLGLSLFEEPGEEPAAGSLDELLAQLQGAERNNDLVAELTEAAPPFPEGEVVLPEDGGSTGSALAKAVRTLRSVVRGQLQVDVIVI